MSTAQPPLATQRAPEAATRWAAGAIVLYVGVLFALRLWLSPYLEIDEAQFVGAVDLRLTYANSHPPLYNWLVRGALEATGWRWPLAVALVKAGVLIAAYAFLYDAARRVAGGRAGLTALAAAAFCPQVSWMAAHTLAHSALAMAAAAATLAALMAAINERSGRAFAALGMAAGVGLLAKFNMALLLAPLALAVAADRKLRAAFYIRRALWAPLLATLVAGPALVAASLDVARSTERLEKLYRGSPFAAIDVPLIGLDGLASLAVATLAWGGLVLALLGVFARRLPAAPTERRLARLLWRTLAFGLCITALGVLFTDVSAVAERYLTPLMMVLPVLAGIQLASAPGGRLVRRAGALAFALVPLGIAGMVVFDTHRFARPYPAFARAIAARIPASEVVAVTSGLHDLAANLALALRASGREAFVAGDRLAPPADVSLRVSLKRVAAREAEASAACPVETLVVEAPMMNWSGRTRRLFATIVPASCQAAASRSSSLTRSSRAAPSPL